MIFTTLEKITGFESTAELVEVLDQLGRVFYYMPNKASKRITFNMPAGTYIFVSECKELKRPLKYVCPELPKKEKHIFVLPEIKIHFGKNPHKAWFKNETGEMFLDDSFLEKSIPQKRFVMGHELGHNYYYSEEKCDYFSAYTMLSEGFNPSQCYYANSFCLSDGAEKRKNILFTELQKVKVYE